MRRIPVISLCVAGVIVFAVCAQADPYWAKSYGGTSGDVARSIQQTTDGGFILAGSTEASGSMQHDFLVLKLDNPGDVQWQKTYGGIVEDGGVNDHAWSIQQTMDGGYIVAGSTDGRTTAFVSFWVVKLDGLGNVAWQKAYNDDTAYDSAKSIRQSSDRGYVVLGTAGLHGDDYWLLKLDSFGEIVWQKTYGRSSRDFAAEIQETMDGGYIVAGSSETADWRFWYWVLKLDGLGEIEWQKAYWGGEDSRASCIEQTVDGGYVVAGNTGVYGAPDSDCWVLKLDGLGEIEWQKAYGGSLDDGCYGIQQTRDGGYIVAGGTESFGAGDSDSWVFKLDSLGGIEWQQAYGGSGQDVAYCVQQTSEDGYIVAARTESFGGGGYDVWVLKLDSQGGIPSCCLMTSGSAEVKHNITQETNTDATVFTPEASVSEVELSVGSSSPTVTDTCEGSCEGWGVSSSVGKAFQPDSEGLNYLILILLPIGAFLFWKSMIRRG